MRSVDTIKAAIERWRKRKEFRGKKKRLWTRRQEKAKKRL